MGIVLHSVSKSLGDELIVNNLSLHVKDGELFVLLGSSGSGKSTILRLIAGLLRPDEGSIELDSKDVTLLPPQKRGIGFVFQNYAIFRHMTVAQNVEFGLLVRNISKEERLKRREELLELVGLAGLDTRFPSELSGGQQQRVALARALAFKPSVLLLDEPFGALDVKIRSQLRRNLQDIQRELKVTSILVTHDQEEAFELAHRIGILDRGRLVEIGSAEDLYHRPRTEYAATFLGRGNLLGGWIDQGQMRLGNQRFPLPPEASEHDEGAPVRILCRPESVGLQKVPFKAEDKVLNLGLGDVKQITFAGAMARVALELELPGVRSIMPPAMYGQKSVRIEALTPSNDLILKNIAVGEQFMVGFSSLHVLQPTGISVIVFAERSELGELATAFGLNLAQRARGPICLFDIVEEGLAASETLASSEKLRQKYSKTFPKIEAHVRSGKVFREMALELQAKHYDILTLGWSSTESYLKLTTRRRMIRQALFLGVALLLVQAPPEDVKDVLVCTAAGEPGKQDVSFAGRIARRTGASVTVLHVLQGHADQRRETIVRRHLSQAEASLEGLGVKGISRLERGDVVQKILEIATGEKSDLIVVGASAAFDKEIPGSANLLLRLLESTKIPILAVPVGHR